MVMIMSEDFYDNMKKEQEILDYSYRESVRQKNERIIHVPTRMKHWEDEMYIAEFEDRWRAYHEYKKLYEYYKELHERGHEYEPNF